MASDFDAAVAYVQALPKDGPIQLSNPEKLEFYAWYKQATEGDVKGTQPWAIQLEARAKWDAWNAVKGMAADEAKTKYVEGLTTIAEKHGGDWRKGPPTAEEVEKAKAAAAASPGTPATPFYDEDTGGAE